MIRASLLLALWAAPAAAEVAFDAGAILDAQAGIFCSTKTDRRDPAPGTVSGYIDIVEDMELRARTTVVPIVQGLTFGVSYTGARDVGDVTSVIRHPPFRGLGRTEQTTERTVLEGVTTIALYTFDHGYEMVAGPWSIEVVEGGRTVLTASFEAVAPTSAPDLVGLCAGEPALSAIPSGPSGSG